MLHRSACPPPSRASALALCGIFSLIAFPLSAQPVPSSTTADADVVSLDEYVVSGYRASLEKSLEVKRESNSIIDVITAEDVGKFPDTNVAESLSHLTGISIDHQFGEGEKVSILGTDPALNRVLVNGQTIASGDWGGNPTDTSGRTFNYSLLSPEIVNTLEVYKATEARIDDGSIGGTVILRTRRPLDLPSNTFRGSLGYAYNDRSEKGNLRGSLLYSWKSKDKKLGALVAVTHDKEYLYRAGIEYWGFGTVAAANNAMVPFGMNSAFFKQTRKRDGIQAALQWKPTDKLEFNLSGVHITGVYDNFSQSRYVVPAYWGTLDSYTVNNGYVVSGHVTAGNATVNGVTLVGPAAVPYAANGQYDTNLRKTEVKTDALNIHGDYRPNGDWHIGFDAGTTKATGGKDPEYLFSLMFNQNYSFAYDGSKSSLSFDDATVATNPAAYVTRRVGDQAGGIEYTTTKDKEDYTQIDFDRPINAGPFKKILFGAKYTDHVNRQESTGNRIDVTAIRSLSTLSPSLSPTGLFDGLGTGGDLAKMVVPTQDAVVSYLLSLPQGVMEEKKGQEWYVREQNLAGYFQSDFTGEGYRGNLGVRVVNTTDESKYWNYNDVTRTYSRVTKDSDYLKFLPSANFTYDLTKNVLLRAGVAKVVARPRYSDLAGHFSLDNTRLTGGGGNPDLKPYESTNVNVSLEWYPSKSSLFAAEFFLRDIDNYILGKTQDKVLFNTATNANATYSVSSPFNAGVAKVSGVAATAQQNLWYGFGIQANGTFTEAETTTGYNMPYLSKWTYNVIPYYEAGKFSARLSYSWRSEFFTSIGRLNQELFADTYKQLDASVSYQVTDNASIVLNATNLLDSTYYWYYKFKYAPMGVYKNGRMLTASMNLKF